MEIVESLNEHIRISLGSDACRFTGYEVLSSTPEDGGVRVRVRVSHASYRVPGPDVDRRRLAVLDFEIDEVHLYGAGGEREQRTGGGAARRGVEVDFDLMRNLQSSDVDAAEGARLGKVLGGGTVAMTGRLAVREAAFTPAVTR